jgi:NAD(P)-dependent dehydrogenase (short-subunit alcohol dehydrogenase family)
MNVLVTGGTGTVGRRCVARLVRAGHSVRVIGLDEGLEIDGAEFRRCDITDYNALREQLKGIDGVVHLAAIPNPAGGTAPAIFHINCTGTFNVYQAAAEEGIKRVVSASSINALGFNFGVKAFQLSYFPIDEKHPQQTTDAYSLSKQMLEETAEYFSRRDGISGVCLRLPAVRDPDDAARARFFANGGQAYQEILALPDAERRTPGTRRCDLGTVRRKPRQSRLRKTAPVETRRRTYPRAGAGFRHATDGLGANQLLDHDSCGRLSAGLREGIDRRLRRRAPALCHPGAKCSRRRQRGATPALLSRRKRAHAPHRRQRISGQHRKGANADQF